MPLSSDLVSQFVKVTREEKQKKEAVVYGTIKLDKGVQYVQLDGSELLTPFSTTTDTLNGERVTVMIKNHNAVVTGNISSPSAKKSTVNEIDERTSALDKKINEHDLIVANKVDTKLFNAEVARIDSVVSDNANITERLEANEGTISSLNSENVTINGKLKTLEADIDRLETDKLDVATAEITYAKISDLESTNVLWGADMSSGMCMTAEHTANLSEAVSAQRYGIVLVFCAYNGNDDTNYSWQSFFVPKQLVALSTAGHTFTLSCGKFTYVGTKYLYINDTSITGHADNNLTGTNNGITFANNKFVLRYVIGI